MHKHRTGGKFSGSHSTIIDAAQPVVDTAAKQSEVTKIVLGIIKTGTKTGQIRLVFKSVPVGWEIKVRGRISIQTLYIHTSEPETTKKAIEEAFSGGR